MWFLQTPDDLDAPSNPLWPHRGGGIGESKPRVGETRQEAESGATQYFLQAAWAGIHISTDTAFGPARPPALVPNPLASRAPSTVPGIVGPRAGDCCESSGPFAHPLAPTPELPAPPAALPQVTKPHGRLQEGATLLPRAARPPAATGPAVRLPLSDLG